MKARLVKFGEIVKAEKLSYFGTYEGRLKDSVQAPLLHSASTTTVVVRMLTAENVMCNEKVDSPSSFWCSEKAKGKFVLISGSPNSGIQSSSRYSGCPYLMVLVSEPGSRAGVNNSGSWTPETTVLASFSRDVIAALHPERFDSVSESTRKRAITPFHVTWPSFVRNVTGHMQ